MNRSPRTPLTLVTNRSSINCSLISSPSTKSIREAGFPASHKGSRRKCSDENGSSGGSNKSTKTAKNEAQRSVKFEIFDENDIWKSPAQAIEDERIEEISASSGETSPDSFNLGQDSTAFYESLRHLVDRHVKSQIAAKCQKRHPLAVQPDVQAVPDVEESCRQRPTPKELDFDLAVEALVSNAIHNAARSLEAERRLVGISSRTHQARNRLEAALNGDEVGRDSNVQIDCWLPVDHADKHEIVVCDVETETSFLFLADHVVEPTVEPEREAAPPQPTTTTAGAQTETPFSEPEASPAAYDQLVKELAELNDKVVGLESERQQLIDQLNCVELEWKDRSYFTHYSRVQAHLNEKEEQIGKSMKVFDQFERICQYQRELVEFAQTLAERSHAVKSEEERLGRMRVELEQDRSRLTAEMCVMSAEAAAARQLSAQSQEQMRRCEAVVAREQADIVELSVERMLNSVVDHEMQEEVAQLREQLEERDATLASLLRAKEAGFLRCKATIGRLLAVFDEPDDWMNGDVSFGSISLSPHRGGSPRDGLRKLIARRKCMFKVPTLPAEDEDAKLLEDKIRSVLRELKEEKNERRESALFRCTEVDILREEEADLKQRVSSLEADNDRLNEELIGVRAERARLQESQKRSEAELRLGKEESSRVLKQKDALLHMSFSSARQLEEYLRSLVVDAKTHLAELRQNDSGCVSPSTEEPSYKNTDELPLVLSSLVELIDDLTAACSDMEAERVLEIEALKRQIMAVESRRDRQETELRSWSSKLATIKHQYDETIRGLENRIQQLCDENLIEIHRNADHEREKAGLLQQLITVQQEKKSLLEENLVSAGKICSMKEQLNDADRMLEVSKQAGTKERTKRDKLKEDLKKKEQEIHLLDRVLNRFLTSLEEEIEVVRQRPKLMKLIQTYSDKYSGKTARH